MNKGNKKILVVTIIQLKSFLPLGSGGNSARFLVNAEMSNNHRTNLERNVTLHLRAKIDCSHTIPLAKKHLKSSDQAVNFPHLVTYSCIMYIGSGITRLHNLVGGFMIKTIYWEVKVPKNPDITNM